MTRHQFFALTNIGYCWCGWSQDSADWEPSEDSHLALMETAFREHLLGDQMIHNTIGLICRSWEPDLKLECRRAEGHEGLHKEFLSGDTWDNNPYSADNGCPALAEMPDDKDMGYWCELVKGHGVVHQVALSDGDLFKWTAVI